MTRSPAAALREAQRWLRDEIRTGRQLKDEIVPRFVRHVDDPDLRRLCESAALDKAARYPNSPPFASPAHWAAFVCAGYS